MKRNINVKTGLKRKPKLARVSVAVTESSDSDSSWYSDNDSGSGSHSYSSSDSGSFSTDLSDDDNLRTTVSVRSKRKKSEKSLFTGTKKFAFNEIYSDDSSKNADTSSSKRSISTSSKNRSRRSDANKNRKIKKWSLVLNEERDNIIVFHGKAEGDPPMYQCTICRRKFPCKANIRYHDICRTGDKPFECDICGDSFKTKHHFESHMNTHSDKKIHKCPICNKKFKHKSSANRHCRKNDVSDKETNLAEVNSSTSSARTLKSPSKSHDKRKKRSLYLEDSDLESDFDDSNAPSVSKTKSFSNAQSEARNDKVVQEKVKKSNWKPISSEDRDHITVIKDNPPLYQCAFCEKKFKFKYDIRKHDFCRTGERPFVCNICGDSFAKKYNFDCHMKTHSEVKSFPCQLCDCAYTQQGSLNRHLKRVHRKS